VDFCNDLQSFVKGEKFLDNLRDYNLLKDSDCFPFENKIGKVYSLDNIDIPKVFFTSHHVGHFCTDVIQGHFWATMRSNNDLRTFLHQCCNQVRWKHRVVQTWWPRQGRDGSCDQAHGSTIAGSQVPTKQESWGNARVKKPRGFHKTSWLRQGVGGGIAWGCTEGVALPHGWRSPSESVPVLLRPG
jgi:hypothetical protein